MLSLKENDQGISNKYTDLYINFLKNANRNVDLIFNNKLIELFKMDYKDFIYKCKNKDIIVGYSSFEIDLLKIINHYKENFQTDVKNFMLHNKLNLFIILSNYIYKTEDHQNEEIRKQIIISHVNDQNQDQDLQNIIIQYLESIIPVTEIKIESAIPEFKGGKSFSNLNNDYFSNFDSKPKSINQEFSFKLFNIHDMSFSRKKLEPLVKDIINNKL